ncbi:MAG: hypothetical protein RIC55_31685 [Pirellulaceae bacterium]
MSSPDRPESDRRQVDRSEVDQSEVDQSETNRPELDPPDCDAQAVAEQSPEARQDAATEHEQTPALREAPSAETPRIRYLAAYAQIFNEQQQGVQNVLLLSVSQFIPFIGLMLLWGFAYEGVEALHRRPRWPQPDFDFSRFSEYLTRGLPPSLFVFILQAISPFLIFMLEIVALVLIAVAVTLLPTTYGGLIMSIVAPILLIGIASLALLATMLLRPMLLRAGLSQEIGQMFRLRWSRDFVARVWPELLLVTLFGYVTYVPLAFLGLCAVVVGILPAYIIWFLAAVHLDYQLYQLYLARGGEPVPLRPPPPRFAHLWNDALDRR